MEVIVSRLLCYIIIVMKKKKKKLNWSIGSFGARAHFLLLLPLRRFSRATRERPRTLQRLVRVRAMQNENEDVIKLRKASKMATVEGIRTVAQIMKKLIHDPWIQSECTRMAWNFIFHFPKFKKIFYDHEGIETTIESIQRHYKNELYGRHISRCGVFYPAWQPL